MPFDDLTQFLQAAADAGELERVAVPLSRDYEVAALTLQICREFDVQSPAILFENLAGNVFPLATNVLGSSQRFLRALSAESFTEVVQRFVTSLNPFPANRDWKFGFATAAASDRQRFQARVIRRGACQQVVKPGKDLDLTELPILKNWEGESGRSITGGQAITESLTGQTVLEAVSLEFVSQDTLLMHWDPAQGLARTWQQYAAANRQMPVAISLGGDPLLAYAATLPIPGFCDPWLMTGLLRNESLNLVRARSLELNVPADAEMILEGYVDPAPASGNGTLADAGGVLQQRTGLPALRLSTMTHRANPIIPARISGFDYGEDFVCSLLTERLLLGILRMLSPAAEDLHLPRCGAHRDAVFVSTTASTPAEVEQLIHACRGLPLLSATRMIVIVDSAVELRGADTVWREVCARLASGGHASLRAADGTLLIDATNVGRQSEFVRARPSAAILSALAERMGNPGWDPLQVAVQSPGKLAPGPETSSI